MLFPDGWLLGRVKRTGEIGYFDASGDNVTMLGVMQVELSKQDIIRAGKVSALRHHNIQVESKGVYIQLLKITQMLSMIEENPRKKVKKLSLLSTVNNGSIRRESTNLSSAASITISTMSRAGSAPGSVTRARSFKRTASFAIGSTMSRFITGKRKTSDVYAKAIKGYNAQEDDECSFENGDQLLVLSRRSPTCDW